MLQIWSHAKVPIGRYKMTEELPGIPRISKSTSTRWPTVWYSSSIHSDPFYALRNLAHCIRYEVLLADWNATAYYNIKRTSVKAGKNINILNTVLSIHSTLARWLFAQVVILGNFFLPKKAKVKAHSHSPQQSADSAVDCVNAEIGVFISLRSNATLCRRRTQKTQ